MRSNCNWQKIDLIIKESEKSGYEYGGFSHFLVNKAE